jgi:RNA polymerase sigma-70 factor (ECF subfamily)
VLTDEDKQALDAFLMQVEQRAYRMAVLAVADRDEALDLVQEAMTRLVRRYAGRPAAEWRPLFYRILHNLINDHYRRGKLRHFVRGWFDADEPVEPSSVAQDGPLEHMARQQAMGTLDTALKALPLRQRQAFLLRCWEGLDVAETARVMGCSQGSVKTHTSRAMQSLRQALGVHWQ